MLTTICMNMAMAQGLLTDKIAIVTGAAGGIGKSICQKFCHEGARVVAFDVNESCLLETKNLCGENCTTFVVDVTNKARITEVLNELLIKYDAPPSVLVNCAGICTDGGLLDLSEDAFDEMISINLKGVFLMTQQVAKVMVAHKVCNGSIINIASILGEKPMPGFCHYGASKAGVVALTKYTARELAEFGIRCNAISPAAIKSPMQQSGIQLTELYEAILLGRLGKPEEVGDVCVFLASEKSSFVNGSVIDVNGGLK